LGFFPPHFSQVCQVLAIRFSNAVPKPCISALN
jgi:hypothetical protein